MADQSADPGFLTSLMAALRPKETGPIPQKWLDAMEKNSNVLNNRINVLIKSAELNNKDQLEQSVLQTQALNSLSAKLGTNLEKTLIDVIKKYDKTEYKNSEAYNQEEIKHKERYAKSYGDQKELFGNLSEKLENVSSNAIGAGVGGGVSAEEAALKEVQVQPISLATIQPEALEALKKVFTTSVNSTPTTANASANTGAGLGIMGAIGSGLGKLSDGLKKLGDTDAMKGAVTIGILGVSLYAAAKGFQEFGLVDWTSIAKGSVALIGLIGASKLLAGSSLEMIVGAAAVAALGGALWLAGKGLKTFAELNWETIGKGFVALLGLGAVAAVLGLVSEFIIPGAIALGVLGVALVPLSVGMAAISKPLTTFTNQLKELAGISALKILEVSVAIGALGLAIAGFGAGTAIAGIGNFVGGLFSKISGQKSPLDQLVAIGEQADNIDRVTNSITAFKQSLSSFGDLSINLDPLKRFVDTINSVNLIKLLAVTAALAVTAPIIRASATNNQTSVQGANIPSITTDAGPAMPVSLVSTKLAVTEAAKLGNVVNTSEAKEINELPVIKVQTENIDKLMKKIDTLISSIEPLAASQQSINSSKNSTATIVNNASNVNNVEANVENSSRDIPYIERSKYRHNMIYARGLL